MTRIALTATIVIACAVPWMPRTLGVATGQLAEAGYSAAVLAVFCMLIGKGIHRLFKRRKAVR